MKRPAFFVSLIILVLVGVGCNPAGRKAAPEMVPGIDANLARMLNGIWEPHSELGFQSKHEGWKATRNYTWGTGKLSPEAAIFDFGAGPPFIQIMGIMMVSVQGVSQPEPNHYVFTTKNMYQVNSDEGQQESIGNIDIVLNADGTITFIGSIGANSEVVEPEQWRFFRTYGPEVSQ